MRYLVTAPTELVLVPKSGVRGMWYTRDGSVKPAVDKYYECWPGWHYIVDAPALPHGLVLLGELDG